MEKIGDAIHAGVDKVKETFSGASKEANKEVAKDSNQSASTRIHAAANAASDKVEETKHCCDKEVNKQKATH